MKDKHRDAEAAQTGRKSGSDWLAPFRKLLEHSNDSIFIVDAATGQVLDLNAIACKHLDSKRKHVVGFSLQEMLPPTSWEAVRERLAGTDNDDSPVSTVLLGADEVKTPVEITVRRDTCADRSIAILVAHETSERKRAKAELRKGERLYRLLAENLLGFIWARDADLSFTYISPSVESLRGYTVEEAMNQTLEEICTPESLPVAVEAFARAKAVPTGDNPNKLHTFELEVCCKDGGTVWVETTVSVFRRKSGRAVGYIGVSRDITDRKRAQEERTKLETQVQHAQKLESLGVLAGGIAHDFNNLLTGMLGYSSMVLLKLPEDSPVRPSVHKIEASAQRAAKLTQQMLAYSGKKKFETGPINLSRLVEDITHLLEVSVSKKALLEYDFDEELPAIQGDAAQIQQVVMNLITNASDAIGDESGTISIKTGIDEFGERHLAGTYVDDKLPGGHYVYLEVSDTGCGMDEMTIARVFDPFFSSKFTGHGLGLAAALGIIRGHHGAIDIKSEPGAYTTFTVYLPASDDPREPSSISGIDESTSFLEWRGNGTVLVVDDEEMVRELCRDTLSDIGFEVMEAGDGFQAMDAVRANAEKIVAVILDLTMPNMDGAEAYKELRRIRADMPIILSSGYDEQEISSRFNLEDLAGFIQKPYQSKELIRRLRHILSG